MTETKIKKQSSANTMIPFGSHFHTLHDKIHAPHSVVSMHFFGTFIASFLTSVTTTMSFTFNLRAVPYQSLRCITFWFRSSRSTAGDWERVQGQVVAENSSHLWRPVQNRQLALPWSEVMACLRPS